MSLLDKAQGTQRVHVMTLLLDTCSVTNLIAFSTTLVLSCPELICLSKWLFMFMYCW